MKDLNNNKAALIASKLTLITGKIKKKLSTIWKILLMQSQFIKSYDTYNSECNGTFNLSIATYEKQMN